MLCSPLLVVLCICSSVLCSIASVSEEGRDNEGGLLQSSGANDQPITQYDDKERADLAPGLSPHMRWHLLNESLPPEHTRSIHHPFMLRQRGNRGKGPCAKGRRRYVRILVVYDMNFCEKFANLSSSIAKNLLERLFSRVEKIFSKNTCVRFRVQFLDGLCDREDFDYDKLHILNECAQSQSACSPSRSILSHLRNKFSTMYNRLRHDVVIYFSSHAEGTSVAGAAFRNGACDRDYGFSWVEGSHSDADHIAITAHELGHLLGADHAPTGVMQKKLPLGKPAGGLSSKSVSEIVKFIDEDPRSWCLAGDDTTDEAIRKAHDWVGVKSDDPNAKIYDVSFMTGPIDGSMNLFILEKTDSGLAYRVARNISCTPTGRCGFSRSNEPINYFTIPIASGSPSSDGFSIASANIRSPSDIIVSYARKMEDKTVAFYTVGYGKSSKSDERSSWSSPLPLPTGQIRDFQAAAIAVAGIVNPKSADLIWIYVDKRNGRNTAFYRVGFQLGTNGKVSGRWTNETRVPGLLGGVIRDVSIELHDITGNGRLDMVFLSSDGSNSFGLNQTIVGDLDDTAAIYRVGKDVDRNGNVTGEWSNHMSVPIAKYYMHKPYGNVGSPLDHREFHTLKASGVAIAEFVKGKPVMVVPTSKEVHTDVRLFSKYRFINEDTAPELDVLPEWRYMFGRNAFSKLSFDPPKLPYALADIANGCSLCYTPEHAEKCVEDLKWCAYQLDEVRFQSADGNESETVRFTSRQTVRMRSEAGNKLLFCDGFVFLFKQEDNCGTTDNRRVVVNGIMQGFWSALEEEAPNQFELLEYIDNFVDSGSVTGANRIPSPPYIVLRSASKGRRETLRRVEQKIRNSPKYASFSLSVKIGRRDGKWWVYFYFEFDEKFLDEL